MHSDLLLKWKGPWIWDFRLNVKTAQLRKENVTCKFRFFPLMLVIKEICNIFLFFLLLVNRPTNQGQNSPSIEVTETVKKVTTQDITRTFSVAEHSKANFIFFVSWSCASGKFLSSN